MNYLQRPMGLFLLLLMIIMGLQAGLKKPLCIDSKVVYKIDKIEAENTDTIYSCDQLKIVPYSGYFYENLNTLQVRLSNLELVLSQLQLTSRFILVFDNVNKNQAHELTNGIQIGTDLLVTDQLEKMLLQFSLKNKLNTTDRVFLETLSDFLMGDGSYQNPISESWGESFTEVNFLKKRSIAALILKNLQPYQESDTKTAIEKLKTLLSVSADEEMGMVFSEKLKDSGFYTQKELLTLKLDVIVEGLEVSSTDAELIKLSKKNKNTKIAIRNSAGLFMLPSFLKIPEVTAAKLFSRYRLIFIRQNENKSVITKNFNNTESLLLIHSPKSPEKLNMGALFTEGIHEFLYQNKKIDFVQIHLPSYKIVYKDLSRISDYFDFVQNKTLAENEHRALGWGRTEWISDLRAYKPIAKFEVIQYFRIN